MNRLLSTVSAAKTMSPSFKNVSHVIFDMDGLLLDTERIYTETTQNILTPYGKTYTWEVKSTLMGRTSEEVAARLVEVYDLPMTPEVYMVLARNEQSLLMSNAELLPDTEKIYVGIIGDVLKELDKPYPLATRMKLLGTTEMRCAEICVEDMQLSISPKEFHTKYAVLCNQRLGTAPLMLGAERLVRHLHSHKIPIALATSSGAKSVAVKTSKHKELFQLFHHQVMGSSDPEVKVGKPAPDIFLIAAKRFPDQPDPANCLVFEDAPNGVKAAMAAGMQVVMVPDPNVTQEEREGATLVLNSLEEFKCEDFGLPPFSS